MTLDDLRSFLLYSTILNYALLLWWFLLFARFRYELFRLHSKWFEIPAELFDRLHYQLMGMYKIGIFLFNLSPLIALQFVG